MRRRISDRAFAAAMLVGLVAVGLGQLEMERSRKTAPVPVDCAASPCPVDRVVDGDTLDVAGERVRLTSSSGPIDAPEMNGGCFIEQARARRARERLAEMTWGGVTIEREGTDRYGRTVAVVRVSGVDVGEVLLAEDHARRFGPNWSRPEWCR